MQSVHRKSLDSGAKHMISILAKLYLEQIHEVV